LELERLAGCDEYVPFCLLASRPHALNVVHALHQVCFVMPAAQLVDLSQVLAIDKNLGTGTIP
jgi:hypothetical protein